MPRASKANDSTFDGFMLLEGKTEAAMSGAVAVVGPDAFLRQQTTIALLDQWKIESDSIDGVWSDEAKWVDVHDRLATRSLFDDAGHRVVVVKSADKFVVSYREQIEKWVESARQDASLILQLDALAANLRLYKLLVKHGAVVDCRLSGGKSVTVGDDRATASWIVSWGRRRHGLRITNPQADLMVQRIGAVFGLLDCELAKLALFADEKGVVGNEVVDELVGGWRTKSAWDIADRIAEGDVAEAMTQLDRLFQAGQNPIGLMAQVSWAMRRFGIAAQVYRQAQAVGQSMKITDALIKAGFYPNQLAAAEKQLRRIGQQRALRMLDWLVELDLKLKGTHSHENRSRLAIEEFILRFA